MSEDYKSSNLYRLRHSASHVIAQAVLEIFSEGKLGIGSAIEDGFYDDFDLPRPLTKEDLGAIEKRMREIVREHHKFVYREVTAEEAREHFIDQPFKVERIVDLEHGDRDEYGNPIGVAVKITFYTDGKFTDLCRGPHVESTDEIKPAGFELLKVAGVYWLGDEKQRMLQRIYGTAWATKEELEDYLNR